MSHWKVSVPEGVSGDYRVVKFVIPEKDFAAFRLACDGRGTKPGTYTKLEHGNKTLMSDTRAEYIDHSGFIYKAAGHVLVVGLGIGMVIQALGNKPGVTKITVIEKSEDVINLVADHYLKMFPGKVHVIHADIFEFNPYEKYDCIWFDIWNDIRLGNLPEMKQLRKKFKKYCTQSDCWSMYELKKQERQEKEYSRFTLFRY